MVFRPAVFDRSSRRRVRTTTSLAALCLVIPLLLFGVRSGAPTLPAAGAVTPHSTQATGYDLVGSDGGVFVFGGNFYGSLPGLGIHVSNIVGMAPAANYAGYYLVGSDGGVFSFGSTTYEGSLPGLNIHVNDIVGIVPSSDDRGYFLVGADGGVFAFGDSQYEGSIPGLGIHVDDVSGIAATPDNQGYWVLQTDGQVNSFGTAPNLAQSSPLPAASGATRYVSIASTSDGKGYWAMNNLGQVFSVGDAAWLGNAPVTPNSVASLVPMGDNGGYWIVGTGGAIFALGDAPYEGSLPGLGVVPNLPIVGAVPTAAPPITSPTAYQPPPPPPPPTTTTTTTTSQPQLEIVPLISSFPEETLGEEPYPPVPESSSGCSGLQSIQNFAAIIGGVAPYTTSFTTSPHIAFGEHYGVAVLISPNGLLSFNNYVDEVGFWITGTPGGEVLEDSVITVTVTDATGATTSVSFPWLIYNPEGIVLCEV